VPPSAAIPVDYYYKCYNYYNNYSYYYNIYYNYHWCRTWNMKSSNTGLRTLDSDGAAICCN